MAAIDYEQELKLIEVLHKDEQEKYHKLDLVNIYGTLDMYQKVLDSYKEDKKYNNNNNSLKNNFSYLKPYTNLVNYIDETENNVQKNIINYLYFFKKPFMGILPFITQEELKAKQEAKNEQIRRLREIMKKKREENYKNMQIELEQLERMIALKDQDKFKFEEMLTNTGYESAEEILQRINKLNAKLNNDIHHLENTQPEDIESRWNLLSMPDEDLTEEQIKLKRIQKMQKNAYYSRLEKKEQARKEKEKIETLKKENKDKYLVSLYRTKKEILERLAKYDELKRDMVNRHSKTNMKRMQTLAELGKDSDGMGGSSWEDDDFGKNDEDWEIYREVNKNNINEEEEEDYNRLHDIENQISEIDKNYFGNVQQYQYNFHQENDYFILGVDQFRCAELLFKPYIIGVDQAGIIEIISQIIKDINLNNKINLAKNIFITGGNTCYPFLKERVYHDMRSYLPVDVDINVIRAENPVLDAWKGARLFFNDTYNLNGIKNNLRENIYITKKEYEEYGVEYFKEHFCGNIKINS
jgi:actin-related protein 5